MAILSAYYRPRSLPEAVALLSRRDVTLAALAGGTWLVGQLESRQAADIQGVVDLRHLGLADMGPDRDDLLVGAMVTLTTLMAYPAAAELAGGLLPGALHYEGPINLRNQATIGGLIATAAADSEAYAALLALAANVVISDGYQSHTWPLVDFTEVPFGHLITAVRIPMTSLAGGHARVARTPSDRPIVAALATVGTDRAGTDKEKVALCGLGRRPLLAGSRLQPLDDFRAGAGYRLAMADVVAARARAAAYGES